MAGWKSIIILLLLIIHAHREMLSGPFKPHNLSEKTGLIEKPAVHVLLILMVGIFVYSNTLGVPFQWDEKDFIVGNQIVKNIGYFLDPASAKDMPYYDALKLRYVGYLTFALNFRLHGFDVLGYHLFNIAVHLLNAFLVYFLIVLTFRTPFLSGSSLKNDDRRIALFAAMLFVSHPLQTEAVTYIFQRLASLSAFFYLLSVVSYAASRLSDKKTNRNVLYALCLVSTVLGMKTKENAFTVPITIALYEFLFFRDGTRNRIIRLLPLLLTLPLIPLTYLGTGKPLGETITALASMDIGYNKTDKWHYLFTQFRVVVTYLRLLFFPVNQNIDHEYALSISFFEPRVFASFLLLSLLLGFGLYLIYKSAAGKTRGKGPDRSWYRLAGFGILWFFATISIESGIVPIPMLIDEYRVYLPSAGFFAVVSVISFVASRRIKLKSSTAFLLCALTVTTLACFAYVRNAIWTTDFTLWEDVVQKNPKSARGYINLGNALVRIWQLDEAEEMLSKAKELAPKSHLPYHNMGELYLRRDEFEKAVKEYAIALSFAPRNEKEMIGIGMAYSLMDKHEKAFEYFSKALAINAGSEIALNAIGFHYAKLKDHQTAISYYDRAIKINQNFATAYINRGKAYAAQNRMADALSDFAVAVRIDPQQVEAYNGRGMAYFEHGEYGPAASDFDKAIEIRPKAANAYYNRGELYLKTGRLKDAENSFRQACSLGYKKACERQDIQ